MATTLDTFGIVKRLKEAGFSEPQAEAMTAVLRETRELDLSELATRADLALLRSDLALLRSDVEKEVAILRSDLAILRSDLMARIETAKSDTVKWVVGVGFAQVATLLAVLRFFPGGHP